MSEKSSIQGSEKDTERQASALAATEKEHAPTSAELASHHSQDDVEKSTAAPPPAAKAGLAPGGFNPADFPDGGAKAWLCVLGGWCCLFCSFGWINCIGVFQAFYEENYLRTYSPSTIAWISAMETFMMFIGGPIVGKINDNYGPRPLLLVGTFFHVFGLMMTSISTKYYQILLAQGVCSPIGASMIFYPAMTSVPTWFFKKRGAAFGIIASGSSLGGVLLPIAVQRLIPEVGFGWAMRITAFIILALMIVANLTVRSRIPPVKRPLVIMEFITPYTEIPFLLLAIGGFLFFLGLFQPINFVIVEATEKGMSVDLAMYLVPILNAASIFGRILPGFIADKVGRFNTFVTMSFFTAIIVLALWLPGNSNAAIIVFAALYGLGSGSYVSLLPSCIAQISDVSKIGVRTGSLFAVVSIAALISNPVGGALVTHDHGGFKDLQIFAGVLLLCGSAFLLVARVVVGGPKPWVKV